MAAAGNFTLVSIFLLLIESFEWQAFNLIEYVRPLFTNNGQQVQFEGVQSHLFHVAGVFRVLF